MTATSHFYQYNAGTAAAYGRTRLWLDEEPVATLETNAPLH